MFASETIQNCKNPTDTLTRSALWVSRIKKNCSLRPIGRHILNSNETVSARR